MAIFVTNILRSRANIGQFVQNISMATFATSAPFCGQRSGSREREFPPLKKQFDLSRLTSAATEGRAVSPLTRILSMILSSCIIYAVVLIAGALIVAIASVFFSGSMVSG
jgi:hypothetical protein